MQPLTRVQALDLLTAAPVAHIGVISNGEPYVTPISFVVTGNLIALRTVPGRRLEAIRENPRVCIEASEFDPTSGEWASAIVWGSAHEIGDTPLRTGVVSMMLEKYRDAIGSPFSRGEIQPFSDQTVVVGVDLEEVTGMSSGAEFGPRTRPGRL